MASLVPSLSADSCSKVISEVKAFHSSKPKAISGSSITRRIRSVKIHELTVQNDSVSKVASVSTPKDDQKPASVEGYHNENTIKVK
ncbi:hypothetical protein NPIL_561291 [Nephila pilipes]|uniref:Uncharacterized protein n=1 Tax=Nephila pilipes TaxID=299642 RepID=A0A8X6USU6_NEPPI|nr:hypothetical protein NPIL_561291 [Nephila pilipes]